MSEFRCFNTYNQSNFSGSDYIKKKKRRTIFTNAQTIAIGNSNYQKGITDNNTVPPGYLQKEDGGETFFNPVYIGTKEENRCLIGAHSYDVLYDVLYGSKPYNEQIISILKDIGNTPQLFFNSQGSVGNIMKIDFKSANDSNIGPAISGVPNGNLNETYYPARQDFIPKYDEKNPPDIFPGMIVDPCYNVFYPQCSTKYRANNYLKNIKYNSSAFSNGISSKETIRFIQDKLYQNVAKFPYPLDFSATRCLTDEQINNAL